MKGQWGLLFALIFALIIAIFSVINVNPVTVNYLFGHAEWPLILVILGSVLMGALIVGSIGIFRVFRLQREVRRLKKQGAESEKQIETYKVNEEASSREAVEEDSLSLQDRKEEEKDSHHQ